MEIWRHMECGRGYSSDKKLIVSSVWPLPNKSRNKSYCILIQKESCNYFRSKYELVAVHLTSETARTLILKFAYDGNDIKLNTVSNTQTPFGLNQIKRGCFSCELRQYKSYLSSTSMGNGCECKYFFRWRFWLSRQWCAQVSAKSCSHKV